MSDKENIKKKGLRFSHVLILNLLVIVSILAGVFYYNNITNTLHNNGKWMSMKTVLDKQVMGALATMETHRALAGNKLDIGIWHGNQELFLKNSGNYESLKFTTRNEKNSHFSFFYELNLDTLKGIRLSENPDFPSISFSLFKGKFTDKEVFKANLSKGKSNKIDLQYNENEVILKVNGNAVFQEKSSKNSGNIFGLRGSERSTIIDNITISSKDQGVLVKEKFNKKLFTPFMIFFAIGALILFNVLLYFLRKNINIVITLVTFGIIFSIGFLVYQKFYNQFRYKQPQKLIKIKVKEKKEKDIVKTYKGKKKKNEIRILFVGSSQTWGAGASKEQDTFVKQFEQLVLNPNSDTTFVCINAGVSGQKSTELLNYYSYLRPELKPDITIVNLSYNDAYHSVPDSIFNWNMQQFVNINKEFGIKTILIPEPNNPDYPDETLQKEVAQKRQIVNSIAKANKIPLVEMQPFIDNHIDDGFLFWDVVHLTDFGQLLFAEELFNQVKDLE